MLPLRNYFANTQRHWYTTYCMIPTPSSKKLVCITGKENILQLVIIDISGRNSSSVVNVFVSKNVKGISFRRSPVK